MCQLQMEGAKVLGIGKINLVSDKIESKALYVPYFPFKLLSVGKITHTLNCLVTFSPYNVIFQNCVTKKKIGEGFFLDGLYYLSKESSFSQGISSQFKPSSRSTFVASKTSSPF